MPQKRIKQSSLLMAIIIAMSITITLLVVFVAIVFSIVGKGIYVQMKADELMPKAESIAQVLTQAFEAGADAKELHKMLEVRKMLANEATVYVLDVNGEGITNDVFEHTYNENITLVKRYFDRVIRGERVSITSQEVGVLVGIPAYSKQGNVIGAVFLVMGVAEVRNTLQSLAFELGIAMLAAAGLMLVPMVILFRKITKPIRHVSEVALSMAAGDLSVRAVEAGSFESRHLARSFNTLVGALQSNIDELVIERNRLQTVLDGLGEGIISVDRHGVITHYNSASVQLLGGDEGQRPAALPKYTDIATCILEVLDSNERRAKDIVVGERMISVVVTPIYEDAGTLCGAVALMRDITESERLEQTRRDYVANVSHELRTPLASIRSLADALNDGMIVNEDDKKRYYGYVLRESIRLSHLIDDLLELSRLQSGGVAFTKGRVELYEIAYDVADRMNDAAKLRGKTVRLSIAEGEYYAYSNADRIEQVLIALVDNAVKHGTDGCNVDISMECDEERNAYVMCVSNPADICEEDIAHLFERFYKADRAHSGEGTGIGLAIVSEVLNLLGESISVEHHDGMISFRFTIGREAKLLTERSIGE